MKTCAERLKLKIATAVEKRQRVLGERREMGDTASRQFAEGEDFLQGQRSKDASITAERKEWYDYTNEGSENLETADSDVALQLLHWEATLKKMDACTVEIAE